MNAALVFWLLNSLCAYSVNTELYTVRMYIRSTESSAVLVSSVLELLDKYKLCMVLLLSANFHNLGQVWVISESVGC